MPKVIIRTEQSIYRCLLGFCFLTTFSAPPQILAASTVFFCPIQKQEEMMGDGFASIATAAGLF